MVCCPPPLKLLRGGGWPPLPTPMLLFFESRPLLGRETLQSGIAAFSNRVPIPVKTANDIGHCLLNN